RLGADEEGVRGLSVGQAGGDQFRDLLLRRRQCVRRRSTAANARELCLGLRFPEGRSESVEGLERSLERLAGGTLLSVPPEDVAEASEGAGALERLLQSVVKHERLLEFLLGRS